MCVLYCLKSIFFCDRKIEDEAWSLMKSGRCLYTEIPKSFQIRESFGKDASCTPYLSFNKKCEDKAPEEEPIDYWIRRIDENGIEYFFNEV